ncbi:Ureidoglycolate lyase [Polystyrenella longa]|uniref:Ureidoglycolate lyase n=1 Tax=Polystyrenella longa TaxID=2528007 RepID=A0A518CIF9_9PLAN|nr:fumarylacetoacetate hydrolase family protein [Polystyrenella longa]QDU79026.1 Ureidoglycolate lyase [Polystyrenella longa]
MRLCRFLQGSSPAVGFYSEQQVIPLAAVAQAAGVEIPDTDSLIPFLPGGSHAETAVSLYKKANEGSASESAIKTGDATLLVPVPRPEKLLLLAGNYAKHIEEGGGKAEERANTIPYVFSKPPTTTLTNPGDPVTIPAISPDHIDWECELAIVIGKRCKGVSEAEAPNYIAGFTVVNDISNRKFRPNPERVTREKDKFFDWLHGKWHDTFCPMGPCIVSSESIADPQQLKLELRVNGNVEQSSSTSEMVFPVAAVVEFVSSFVTLEPGDIISTGTPAGVGMAKNKYLKPGDVTEAEIEGIGILRNTFVAE